MSRDSAAQQQHFIIFKLELSSRVFESFSLYPEVLSHRLHMHYRNGILSDQVKGSSESQRELKIAPLPENLVCVL